MMKANDAATSASTILRFVLLAAWAIAGAGCDVSAEDEEESLQQPGIATIRHVCVPSAIPDVVCPEVRATIQRAIDVAGRGTTIIVGAGSAPERLVIGKAVKIVCAPGAVLRDQGLAPGGTFITYTGKHNLSQIIGCTMEVSASTNGIEVPATASWVKVLDATLVRKNARQGTGIKVT